jgi:putative solute:sodium symporter small subunit
MRENRGSRIVCHCGQENAATPTMSEPPADENQQRHWQRNTRLTTGLLVVWFVVSFVAPYFARELDFNVFGWPFSFWLAAQGALIVYLAIVWFYAHRMERLDRAHDVAEEP